MTEGQLPFVWRCRVVDVLLLLCMNGLIVEVSYMEIKNVYEDPQMEVIEFSEVDIITTSGGIELPDDDWE